jgi:hypothetical protein
VADYRAYQVGIDGHIVGYDNHSSVPTTWKPSPKPSSWLTAMTSSYGAARAWSSGSKPRQIRFERFTSSPVS